MICFLHFGLMHIFVLLMAAILVPQAHPHVDLGMFPVLGTILSHGFLVTRTLAVRIAFPCLAAVVLGPMVTFQGGPLHTPLDSGWNYHLHTSPTVSLKKLKFVNMLG